MGEQRHAPARELPAQVRVFQQTLYTQFHAAYFLINVRETQNKSLAIMKVRLSRRMAQGPIAQAPVRRFQHRRDADLDLRRPCLRKCERIDTRLQRPAFGP